jgi:hypothetical protein
MVTTLVMVRPPFEDTGQERYNRAALKAKMDPTRWQEFARVTLAFCAPGITRTHPEAVRPIPITSIPAPISRMLIEPLSLNVLAATYAIYKGIIPTNKVLRISTR